MTAEDLRRIALSFPEIKESAHMGSPDFRTGGHLATESRATATSASARSFVVIPESTRAATT